MKTIKILSVLFYLAVLISCEKEDPLNKFEAILGKWETTGYSGRGDFEIDSAGVWASQIELLDDSTCYYYEYEWRLDSTTLLDSGSFYLLKDTLYLNGIQPHYLGYSKPFRGKVWLKNDDEFHLLYKINNDITGEVAEVERFFNRK